MFRVTNGMMAANTLRNIGAAASRLATANEAVASNMKIQLASDDSKVATRAVTYRSYVSQIKQYQDNADAADAWQTVTDDSLSAVSDYVSQLKEYATAASSDTKTAEDLQSIKTSVEALLKDVISVLNNDTSGSYIFGGYSTSEAPYEVVSTDIGDTVTFKGEYLSLGGVISAEVSDSDIQNFYAANASNVYDSLTDAADAALAANTKAQAALAADPTNVILIAKAASAQTTSDTLAAAVTTYGGSTNLTTAAAEAETDVDTLTTAITTYGGTTDLTTAAANALADYTTAQAAADADSTDTALAEAAAKAKITSDTLATAVTTYGGATTLTAAAAEADTTSKTLAAAVTNSDQDINYNINFGTEVTVNVEGQDVTGEGSDNLFNTIQKLLLALDGDTSYKTVTGTDSSGTAIVETVDLSITDLIDEFNTALGRVTASQASLGASMSSVTNVADRLDEAYEAYSSLLTDNENIDTAVATTELSSAEYTYEAALAVGAKVISKSLIDYIA
ncbi:flagellin [Sporomusa malonica]|uniref:Flagellar hook-associated protein 3 FlgL n=1 Tax=Sporomusa malonica TaxID=112901 RepID=A0A1W2EJK7_9FIRM|nr:flagellin [Sporomusa malonica]SMD09785.1 flagellar hook-associated protein 3 FlgL [Sporomusa malonica]